MERVLGNAPRVLEVAKKMRQSWHGVFGEPVTGIDINYSSIPEKFLNILESGIDLAIE